MPVDHERQIWMIRIVFAKVAVQIPKDRDQFDILNFECGCLNIGDSRGILTQRAQRKTREKNHANELAEIFHGSMYSYDLLGRYQHGDFFRECGKTVDLARVSPKNGCISPIVSARESGAYACGDITDKKVKMTTP